MNERIVKLFMESVDSNYIPLPIEDHMPSWTEKFAELIARQCAEVGLDSVEDGDDLDAIMKRVHNNILTHFGVEE